MDTFWQDLRYAIRMLMKNRGFAIMAVLTLALGIGANTAIFSVVNAVLLRALPYPDAGSLVFLRETVGKTGFGSISYPNYLDWRAENQVFSELAAYSSSDLNLSGGGAAERVDGEVVTNTYFPLLGVQAIRGRIFRPEENETPGASPVAVISYGLWQQRFGGDAAVLGRNIKVNDAPFTIVGIAPQNFRGVTGHSDIWLPLIMRDSLWPEAAQFDFLHKRDIHWHRALARLKPGVTLERARADMDTIGTRTAQADPQANKDRGVQVLSASEAYLGRLRAPLLLLLGAVGCVLLIACGNVANLFLMRAAARENEMAIRTALGAGRGRLLQQWVTESLLVSLLGGVLGLLVVAWGVDLLVKILPVSLPAFSTVRVDRSVLIFTTAVSIVLGLVLGLVPALRASQKDLIGSLKEGGKASEGRHGRRAGGLLVASEMALALVVMIGAGLLLRSFEQLRHVDPGFRPDHLLMMRFDVPTKYSGEDRLRVGPRIVERIQALSEVESAGVSIIDPFVWGGINRGITVEGRPPLTPTEQDAIYTQEIGPNYFRTMGIPLRTGRDFTLADDSAAPHVVIVSQAFAQRYWPGQDPVGKRVKYGPAGSHYNWMDIVGVAGDMRFESLREDPYEAPVIYAPLQQSEVIIGMSLMVRTKVDPASLVATARREIERFDPDVPVYSIATMDERLEGQSANTRAFALLLGLFALLAASLAAVGCYGVMASRVTRRTREIGIRLALGAQPADVVRMVVTQGLRAVVFGVCLGVIVAFWASRLLASQLFGVKAIDPVTFAVAAAVLCGVALAACYIPARRAMSVDPIVALRYE